MHVSAYRVNAYRAAEIWTLVPHVGGVFSALSRLLSSGRTGQNAHLLSRPSEPLCSLNTTPGLEFDLALQYAHSPDLVSTGLPTAFGGVHLPVWTTSDWRLAVWWAGHYQYSQSTKKSSSANKLKNEIPRSAWMVTWRLLRLLW